MERRRTLGSEGESMKEWRILLDKTVTDNSIASYAVDTQNCTEEFYVSIFFTNDPDITKVINGRIALNTDHPWSNGENCITDNIQNLAYNQNGNNNKAIVFRFEVVNGYIIPKGSFVSSNTGASSNQLVNGGAVSLSLVKEDDTLRYRKINSVEKIAVGSYTKYFGVGSKILIMGR